MPQQKINLPSPLLHPRLRREDQTLELMIQRFCRDTHRQSLCPECAQLLSHARSRLRGCPFQEHKSTCRNCAIHCYAPKQRAAIAQVMRHSGPRLLWRHPLLSLLHWLDGLRGARKRS